MGEKILDHTLFKIPDASSFLIRNRGPGPSNNPTPQASCSTATSSSSFMNREFPSSWGRPARLPVGPPPASKGGGLYPSLTNRSNVSSFIQPSFSGNLFQSTPLHPMRNARGEETHSKATMQSGYIEPYGRSGLQSVDGSCRSVVSNNMKELLDHALQRMHAKFMERTFLRGHEEMEYAEHFFRTVHKYLPEVAHEMEAEVGSIAGSSRPGSSWRSEFGGSAVSDCSRSTISTMFSASSNVRKASQQRNYFKTGEHARTKPKSLISGGICNKLQGSLSITKTVKSTTRKRKRSSSPDNLSDSDAPQTVRLRKNREHSRDQEAAINSRHTLDSPKMLFGLENSSNSISTVKRVRNSRKLSIKLTRCDNSTPRASNHRRRGRTTEKKITKQKRDSLHVKTVVDVSICTRSGRIVKKPEFFNPPPVKCRKEPLADAKVARDSGVDVCSNTSSLASSKASTTKVTKTRNVPKSKECPKNIQKNNDCMSKTAVNCSTLPTPKTIRTEKLPKRDAIFKVPANPAPVRKQRQQKAAPVETILKLKATTTGDTLNVTAMTTTRSGRSVKQPSEFWREFDTTSVKVHNSSTDCEASPVKQKRKKKASPKANTTSKENIPPPKKVVPAKKKKCPPTKSPVKTVKAGKKPAEKKSVNVSNEQALSAFNNSFDDVNICVPEIKAKVPATKGKSKKIKNLGAQTPPLFFCGGKPQILPGVTPMLISPQNWHTSQRSESDVKELQKKKTKKGIAVVKRADCKPTQRPKNNKAFIKAMQCLMSQNNDVSPSESEEDSDMEET